MFLKGVLLEIRTPVSPATSTSLREPDYCSATVRLRTAPTRCVSAGSLAVMVFIVFVQCVQSVVKVPTPNVTVADQRSVSTPNASVANQRAVSASSACVKNQRAIPTPDATVTNHRAVPAPSANVTNQRAVPTVIANSLPTYNAVVTNQKAIPIQNDQSESSSHAQCHCGQLESSLSWRTILLPPPQCPCDQSGSVYPMPL